MTRVDNIKCPIYHRISFFGRASSGVEEGIGRLGRCDWPCMNSLNCSTIQMSSRVVEEGCFAKGSSDTDKYTMNRNKNCIVPQRYFCDQLW